MDNKKNIYFASLFLLAISLFGIFISVYTYIQYVYLHDVITYSVVFSSIIFCSPLTLYLSLTCYFFAKRSIKTVINLKLFYFFCAIALLGLFFSIIFSTKVKDDLLSTGYVICVDKTSNFVTVYAKNNQFCEK
ncbi:MULTISPECIES: DUF1240 domain-containing protein [Providencia]|uniref:DUF1240 domain-containing protein n=1 Tax=Providencia TaxID=586 RepID=UPI0024B23505